MHYSTLYFIQTDRGPCSFRSVRDPSVFKDLASDRNFKLVMIQSSHRFGLAASLPKLSESSLAGGLSEGAHSEPERSEGERSEAEDRSPPSQTRSRPGVWGGTPNDTIKPTGFVSPRGA